MWLNPLSAVAAIGGDITQVDEGGLQEEFDLFYEEIFEELANFGELEEVQVCENLGDHMVGNVYVKYPDEEQAEECIKKIHGRYFAGRLLAAEFSPVTDFREARCRQYDEGTCTRGGFCNFLHIREPSPELRKFLEKEYNFRGGRQKGAAGMNTMRIATGDVAGRDKGRRDDDRFRDADRYDLFIIPYRRIY
jgi:splicing factor U2AF subunit